MEKSLHQLGLECHTDKATYHKFCDFYDKYLMHLRKKELNFFEIGIYKGESLMLWNHYFSNVHLYSIDIKDMSIFNKQNIITAICDQGNKKLLSKVFEGVVFDVILDDGGHKMTQQQLSLGTLFKRLKSGGIYIIEDLHTSLMEGYRDFKGYETSTLSLLDEYRNTGKVSSIYLTDEENEYLSNNIDNITIFSTKPKSITSVIIKK